MGTLEVELKGCLEDLSAPLARVTTRRMFGCDVFMAGGAMFALVVPGGRIGLKLPDDALEQLRAVRGADAWKPGDMVMRQWVLVPESFHDDPARLGSWVGRAHAAALERPRPRKSAKRAPRTRPRGRVS